MARTAKNVATDENGNAIEKVKKELFDYEFSVEFKAKGRKFETIESVKAENLTKGFAKVAGAYAKKNGYELLAISVLKDEIIAE